MSDSCSGLARKKVLHVGVQTIALLQSSRRAMECDQFFMLPSNIYGLCQVKIELWHHAEI